MEELFQGSDGFIFVIDSRDEFRFAEARKELEWILESDKMAGIPFVVFANKQDLPLVASPLEVTDSLGLSQVCNRQWHVRGTSVIYGSGLSEGMLDLLVNFSLGIEGV